MKITTRTIVAAAAFAVVCSLAPCFSVAQAAPDNTKQNKDHAVTADSQPNAAADRATTAKVRKAIMDDKNLSTYAHNIKIITGNGQVTLKGPVKSEEEKQQIVTDVSAVISPDSITNQLTVKQ